MSAQPTIDPYDQDTLDYLVAAGVNLSLVERVNRLAKDCAAWKAEAETAKQARDFGRRLEAEALLEEM